MIARFISAAAGVWLMAAPSVLGYSGLPAKLDRTLGPIAAAIALIAINEVTRPVRWGNLLIGLALVALPWLVGYPVEAAISSTAAGVVIAAASTVRGRLEERLGGGWSVLWRA